MSEELWIPLVDEPIGSIVAKIQAEQPEIAQLVATPKRLLAFKTFAYIRVGIVLGELLVDDDLEPYNGTETWIDALLQNPRHRQRVVDEVRRVAEEIAADERYAGDTPVGPDDATRERFRAFARSQRGEPDR